MKARDHQDKLARLENPKESNGDVILSRDVLVYGIDFHSNDHSLGTQGQTY